jgi:porphobilinogen deaminase
MAHLETKIFNLLTADAAVKAIVADRVYPSQLKQGCRLPAISFVRVSGGFDLDLEGNSGTENPRIQVDCWALGYQQAKDLGKAVRRAMNAATAAGAGFTATAINDADIHDDAANYHGVSIDFSCWHEED